MRATALLILLLPLVLFAAPFSGEDGAGEAALSFDRFHSLAEIEQAFETLARRHPRWFRIESLGRSVQGRAIPLLAISDFEAQERKAALWVDGAIHGGELASAEPPLALVEHLRALMVAGAAPAWLERVVVYVVPVINVDGRHLALRPPYLDQRRNLRPVDDDGDGRLDEDGPVDLNGDGRVVRVTTSGARVLEARDLDGDGRCGEDPPGGIDLNRNFPVARAERPGGWRPEPEVAAVVAFWERHPEIELAFSYHTSANVLVWPPSAGDGRAPERLERITSLYREHLGDRVWRTQEALSGLVGTSMEWFHAERGAAAFTIEMAGPPHLEPAAVDRPFDRVRHPCAGEVLVERVDEGYSKRLETRLERDLAAVVAPHVAFLLAAAESIAVGPTSPEKH